MKIYLNGSGELACSPPEENDTVADLAQAVEEFCQDNITCSGCTDTCCAGFVVFADNVFWHNLDQLLRNADQTDEQTNMLARLVRLDPVSRKWFVPQRQDGKCQYLSSQGRCLLYQFRPLVCRLHVCRPAEESYRQLKDDLYFAYQEALRLEMSRLAKNGEASVMPYWSGPNPLLGMTNYSASIREVREWSNATKRRIEA